MRRIRIAGSIAVLGLLMMLDSPGSHAGAAPRCSLPPEIVPFQVLPVDEQSFTPVNFTEMPAGYALTNGTYQGWCVEYDVLVNSHTTYHARFYDSLSPTPAHLQNLPWNRVNYILNHKRGSIGDIQFAIWYALRQISNPPANSHQTQLKNDVDLHGDSFTPTNGQIVGILVESEEGVQRIIMETAWDEVCRDQTPPAIAITSPPNGALYNQAQTITITAQASDNIAVARVEFYNGTNLQATLTNTPYSIDWPFTDLDNGTHSWTVTAYDEAGNSTDSTPVLVTIAIDVIPPTVTITSPSTGGTYVTPQSIPIVIEASDAFGVTHIEIYDNNNLITTLTNTSRSFDWLVTGTHNGSHSITARAFDAAGNSTLSDPVIVIVAIDVTPPAIAIISPPNGTTVSNTQTLSIIASASDNVGVTTVEFYRDSLLVGSLNAAPYQFNWPVTSANNGTHSWTARAFDDAGHMTTSDPIAIHIQIDSEPPSIAIGNPPNGTHYTNIQTVVIAADVTDNFGVARVEFHLDGLLAGSRAGAPYTFDWPITPADNGPHSWTARAYDHAGNSTLSAAVAITILIDLTPPVVSISNPPSGTAVTQPQTIAFTTGASDNIGVTHVEYFKDGVSQGSQSLSPYSHSWTVSGTDNGTHSWTARAFDAAGNSTLSVPIIVIVDIDVTPPAIAITSPPNGTTVSNAQTLSIIANASDNVGVTTVEFYRDSLLAGSLNAAPYQIDWPVTSADNGLHSWTARAFDDAGHMTTSDAIGINIQIDSEPPSIAISSPPNGAHYTNTQTVVIAADVTDNFGVARVEFHLDGLLAGSRAGAPYTFDWPITPADNGPHSWTARAYDHAGNSTLSAAVAITILIDSTPPVVSISNPPSGTAVTQPQTIAFTTGASDNIGVTHVEYFKDGVSQGSQSLPPYSHSWTVSGTDNGTHSWTARAFDAAGNNTLSDPVIVIVDIDVTPPAIAITSPPNGTTVSNAQTLSIIASASDNVGVTTVEFYRDSLLAGTLNAAPYQLNWPVTSADNGTHSWTARAFDDAGHMTASGAIAIHIQIDSEPPSVAISSPAGGSRYTNAQTVVIAADATDNFGVARVEFHLDGLLAGSRAGAPYTFDWPITATDNGLHSWTARAYDHAGNNTTSTAVELRVDLDIIPPAIAIVAPPSGNTITQSGSVSIVTESSDNVGVTRVEYYEGTTLRGSTATEPHTFIWPVTENENGSHAWSARAYDAAGNSTVSAPIGILIRIDETAPEVVLTAPAEGSLFEHSQTVTITADATDNLGIDRVEFFAGTHPLGTRTTAPYHLDWSVSAADNGSHALSARAYDEAGNRTDSPPVTVNVAIDVVPPLVVISSPASGTLLTHPQEVLLVAEASDNVAVARVEFYHGDVMKGSMTSPPYTMGWTVGAVDNGSHAWMARAYDAAGNSSDSADTLLQVEIDNVAPSVSIIDPPGGTRLIGPQQLTITADASDDFGVVRVEFYRDSVLIDTVLAPPYSVPWSITPTNSRNHVWTARAYDAAGNNRLSEPVAVFVELDATPPIVTIHPLLPSIYSPTTLVRITGTATDNADITQVLLYLPDSEPRIVDGTTNWSTVVEVDHGETYTARVWAVDRSGNSSLVATRHFTHVHPSSTSPVLIFSLPQPGVARIDFYAPWNREFDVHVSTDLVNWIRLGPALHAYFGQFYFEDRSARSRTRYYRVVRTK